MKQASSHTHYWKKQAGAIGCLILLSFMLCVQAFHHHHDLTKTSDVLHIEQLVSGSNNHCAICDHINTGSVSGEPGWIDYLPAPPQPQLYNPYSYYLSIDRELFLLAYTNKGPPFFALFTA